jgi:hypothetical protein
LEIGDLLHVYEYMGTELTKIIVQQGYSRSAVADLNCIFPGTVPHSSNSPLEHSTLSLARPAAYRPILRFMRSSSSSASQF